MTVESFAVIIGMVLNLGAIVLMIHRIGIWMGTVQAELSAIHQVLSEIKKEAVTSRERLDEALQRISRLEGGQAA